mmetsp:Transcript_42950/g.77634  ORF Transcript_42950/g.77634 Transcript_42950/m.77634 type:complete len:296 (+) Transcript_42950:656-1543(+)
MSTDDRHVDEVWVPAGLRPDELVGAHHVQGADANDLQGVQALLLVELGHGWHDGVHWVDYHAKNCPGTELGARLNNALGDVRVDLEEVVTGLPWLARHACRDEDQVAASEALLQVVDRLLSNVHLVASDRVLPLEVAQVGCHAGWRHHGHAEVEDAELLDVGVQAHEQRKRLTDAAGTAADADLEVTRRFLLHHRLGLDLWLWFVGLLSLLSLLWLLLLGSLALALALWLLALDLAVLPVGCEGLRLVLLLVEGLELLPGVRDTVFLIDAALANDHLCKLSKQLELVTRGAVWFA